jgi:uncharacterized protein YndB with AHSA1/START domain
VIPDSAFAIELEHRVGGSPETVFSYFTDAAKHGRWMGAEVELDPKPGGIYRVTMAPGVFVRGEFLVVEPPHRLLFTWGWDGEIDLPRGLKQVAPGSSAVEFRFVADGDGTIIRIRHLGLPSEESRWTHTLGWNGYVPRLDAILTGGDPGEDPLLELAAVFYARDAGTGGDAAR